MQIYKHAYIHIKWAYTNRIFVRYPLVTSVIRFSTWLRAIRIATLVLCEPNQASTFSFRFPDSSLMSWKSKFRCLKSRQSLPRGSSASISLAFNIICTSSGMSMVSEDNMVFNFYFYFCYYKIKPRIFLLLLLLFFYFLFCFNFSFSSLFSFKGAMMIYVETFRDLFPY